MAWLWKIESSRFEHYTDMCIYMEKYLIPYITVAGEEPEYEDQVYNYLWLLVKALAMKAQLLKYSEYDAFAFYAAERLFFAIRKNAWNVGKTIKGRSIKPIKSVLNYTKSLLYPMKVEFQNKTYNQIIDEDYASKTFDSFAFKEELKDNIRANQSMNKLFFKDTVYGVFKNIDNILTNTLVNTPFRSNSADYQKLKVSVLLNTISNLNSDNFLNDVEGTIAVYGMPKSTQLYIKVLTKNFYTNLKNEIVDQGSAFTIDESTVEQILNYKESNDNEHEK